MDAIAGHLDTISVVYESKEELKELYEGAAIRTTKTCTLII